MPEKISLPETFCSVVLQVLSMMSCTESEIGPADTPAALTRPSNNGTIPSAQQLLPSTTVRLLALHASIVNTARPTTCLGCRFSSESRAASADSGARSAVPSLVGVKPAFPYLSFMFTQSLGIPAVAHTFIELGWRAGSTTILRL